MIIYIIWPDCISLFSLVYSGHIFLCTSQHGVPIYPVNACKFSVFHLAAGRVGNPAI